jgi:hypothetical protein
LSVTFASEKWKVEVKASWNVNAVGYAFSVFFFVLSTTIGFKINYIFYKSKQKLKKRLKNKALFHCKVNISDYAIIKKSIKLKK